MPKQKDVKRLERLAEDVFEIPFPELNFFYRTSVRTVDPDATIQERNLIVVGGGKRCIFSRTIDISGASRTGRDGKMTWRLRDFITPCDSQFEVFDRPLSFLVTPHSDSPVYLTTVPSFTATKDNVVVEVLSWDRNGDPAPNISFSWRCRVPYPAVVD